MTVTQRLFRELINQRKTIASLCTYIDVKSNVVANWKAQNTIPPARYLVSICEFLDISADYLLTGEDAWQRDVLETSIDRQRLLKYYDLMTDFEKGELLGEMKSITKDRTEDFSPNIA